MQDYVLKNRQSWQALEALVAKANRGRGLSRMGPEELAQLDALYRATAVHLAQVATRTDDRALLRYLNDLTAAAHAIIYLPPRRSLLAQAAVFFGVGFPAVVMRRWPYMLASTMLFALGLVLGFVVAQGDPVASYALLPPGEERQVGADPAVLEKYLRSGRETSQAERFAFSTFLFNNNIKVGALSAASGVLAGVPTIFLIAFNGMLIGVMTAAYHGAGLGWQWWAWILPHGVTELAAIIISGGAGLLLGRAVVVPGWASRMDRLREAGRDLAVIVVGVAAMLVVAAAVEGFLRQTTLSDTIRHAFAACTWVVWCLYFWNGWLAMRRDKTLATDESAQ